MKSYFVKTPGLVPVLYRNQIWSFSSIKKEIYLTFDDGPTPKITDWVLDTLQQYNANATFFCIGKNIEEHSKIFKRIIDSGHAIGNHTHDHLNGWKTATKEYLDSVLKTEKAIEKNQIANSKLFRPPYGKITRPQTNALIKEGYKIIMWSVLSADFDSTIDQVRCLDNVIKNAKKGSVIVFHDSEKAFKKLQVVLPRVLEYFSKKGYAFRKIEESPII